MGGVIGCRNVSAGSLGEHGLGGKHHIAEGTRLACNRAGRIPRGKRQHIGGGVLAAPGTVERAHLGIVGQDDGRLARLLPSMRSCSEGGTRRARKDLVARSDAVPNLSMADDVNLEE
jgi:hypothetical protein